LRGDGRPHCDFSSYESLVRFWLEQLCACEKYNVVVSLHPRAIASDVECILDYRAKVANRRISELLPLCDLFVASASATIRMAISTGKPALNYDVFRYEYSDYAKITGVITVKEQTEFTSALRRLTSNDAYYRQVQAAQAEFARQWVLLDGHAGERMLNLFDRLVGDRGIPRPALTAIASSSTLRTRL
jgi:hypothetical protein